MPSTFFTGDGADEKPSSFGIEPVEARPKYPSVRLHIVGDPVAAEPIKREAPIYADRKDRWATAARAKTMHPREQEGPRLR